MGTCHRLLAHGMPHASVHCCAPEDIDHATANHLLVLQAIVAGIEAVDVVPGRTEIIDEGQSFPVIVDNANTPQALSRQGPKSHTCLQVMQASHVDSGGEHAGHDSIHQNPVTYVYRLLETVRDTGPRRILTVFGAEGHGDSSLRPVLGEILHYKVREPPPADNSHGHATARC